MGWDAPEADRKDSEGREPLTFEGSGDNVAYGSNEGGVLEVFPPQWQEESCLHHSEAGQKPYRLQRASSENSPIYASFRFLCLVISSCDIKAFSKVLLLQCGLGHIQVREESVWSRKGETDFAHLDVSFMIAVLIEGSGTAESGHQGSD